MIRNGGAALIAAAFAIHPFMASASATEAPKAMPMSPSASAKSMPMAMPMSDAPAHFPPTRAAYSRNHLFLVKLLDLPRPIPYQKYFTLRFAVYDGHDPRHRLGDATLALYAGMRHGLKTGFAHGMDSTPKIVAKGGVFTVSGMYFHMMGAWTLKMTVHEGTKQGIVYFNLPCCGA